MIVVVIVGFILTISCIFLTAYLINKANYTFPFEESMDTVKLPIISFEHKGKIVNFIIDSGATHSIIEKDYIEDFDYLTATNAKGYVRGINGERVETALARVELVKDGHTFSDVFQVLPVPTLKMQEQKHGIKIHGLLGSQFLRKYRFLINYKHLNAYTNG
jgi:hypothetical protein